MSKWQIFASGVRTGSPIAIALVVFAVLNSLLSLGYYAPLVSMMYRTTPSEAVTAGMRIPSGMTIPLVLLVVVVVAFGVWPALANGLTIPAGQIVLSIFTGKGGM
jgi:NADH:ubiquinone oxidoreductase subunit 2 (subunit N)